MIKENKWFVQNEIAEKVIELSGINIFERSRKREIVEMRSLFFYILKNKLDMGLTEMSRYFEDSASSINHATIIWALKNYELYKSTNKRIQEIEEMIILKTSMNIKGINRETYLELKCKELEAEIERLNTKPNESKIIDLINKVPKEREGEFITRMELMLKGWQWQYRDSTTAYAGE
tara:strand:+ start:300 stop:830 length:531 start_codon:yes stop_codon:yes gene_type:complete